MAHAPLGAQPGAAGDDLAHQFVGVQGAFHQRFGAAGAHQRHRLRRSVVAVRDVDDLHRAQVELPFARDGADLLLRPHQDGNDEAGLGRGDHAAERLGVAGMRHRHQRGGHVPGALQQVAVARLAVEESHLGQFDARALDLLRRRQHLGRSADDLLPVLVGAHAVENDVMVVVELARRRERDRDGVAQADRTREMQGLVYVDGARAGELRSEHGGDQRPAPHAVGDDLAKHAALGEFRVDVRGVDVARHDGEQLDVGGLERAGDGGGIADLDFVVSAVLDVFQGGHRCGLAWSTPAQSMRETPLRRCALSNSGGTGPGPGRGVLEEKLRPC